MRKEKELIKIEFPYDQMYDWGYLIIENSKVYIKLKEINSNQYIKKVSYARYLISVNLHRFLDKNEKVMHIDKNPENNNLENLKLIVFNNKEVKEEEKQLVHIEKSTSKQEELFEAYCSCCGKKYLRKTKILYKNNFCSPQCQHKLNRKSANYFNQLLTPYSKLKRQN